MDQTNSKLQNMILAVLIALLAAYVLYNYLYGPKIKEIASLKSSLQLIDSEIRMIDGGSLLLKDVNTARAFIQKEIEALSTKIPLEIEAPYVVNKFVSQVGKGLNIDYNLIQPSDVVTERNYRRLPLNVEFEGDYSNLNIYLAQLKKLPVTVRVDNMGIHKIGDSNKLSIKMALSAFMMPGGTEAPAVKPITSYNLYDPFYTSRAKTEELKIEGVQTLKFSGYIKSKDMGAIINDDIYKTGQIVKGFKVLKIYKDRVILQKSGKLYELPIGGAK